MKKVILAAILGVLVLSGTAHAETKCKMGTTCSSKIYSKEFLKALEAFQESLKHPKPHTLTLEQKLARIQELQAIEGMNQYQAPEITTPSKKFDVYTESTEVPVKKEEGDPLQWMRDLPSPTPPSNKYEDIVGGFIRGERTYQEEPEHKDPRPHSFSRGYNDDDRVRDLNNAQMFWSDPQHNNPYYGTQNH